MNQCSQTRMNPCSPTLHPSSSVVSPTPRQTGLPNQMACLVPLGTITIRSIRYCKKSKPPQTASGWFTYPFSNRCMYVCMSVCNVMQCNAMQCNVCSYVCSYVCMFVCMYVRMYVICMHACMHVCMYVCMYVMHILNAHIYI